MNLVRFYWINKSWPNVDAMGNDGGDSTAIYFTKLMGIYLYQLTQGKDMEYLY
jgi:hypothetical protein